MEHTGYFQKLQARERALTLNPGVAGLLNETQGAAFAGRPLAPLLRECLVANVAYAYQHHGFCVFAPSAQALLAAALARDTGLSFDDVSRWLEDVSYALLQDFALLRMLDGEPDWQAVDTAFFRSLCKRAICAEPGETFELGLDGWDMELVAYLRVVSSEALELVRAGADPEDVIRYVGERMDARPDVAVFEEALCECLGELRENPLRLLVWRVECFSSFSDIRQEAKFFVRNDSSQVERHAFELAGFLSALHPHRTENGACLLEESPVTVAQIERALVGRTRGSALFDCGLLREWMRLPDGDTSVDKTARTAALNQILQDCLRLGLVFELVQRTGRTQVRTVKKVGLTRTALGILRPFAASIEQALRR